MNDVLQRFFESEDRLQFVRDLDESRENGAVEVLVRVILDVKEEDYLGTEALAVARHRAWESIEGSDQLAKAVLGALADGDELIRQHAANAAGAFREHSGVVARLTEIAGDPSEDEDVRVNATAALRAEN